MTDDPIYLVFITTLAGPVIGALKGVLLSVGASRSVTAIHLITQTAIGTVVSVIACQIGFFISTFAVSDIGYSFVLMIMIYVAIMLAYLLPAFISSNRNRTK
jgi:ABC-type lipoprotein release transport system permease subunit